MRSSKSRQDISIWDYCFTHRSVWLYSSSNCNRYERLCMALTEDLPQLERMLNELITRYEQYFIGLEKREPLPMREEVEKLVRRYANTQINNTMFKHKYSTLMARFNTYREHWNRTIRSVSYTHLTLPTKRIV